MDLKFPLTLSFQFEASFTNSGENFPFDWEETAIRYQSARMSIRFSEVSMYLLTDDHIHVPDKVNEYALPD